MGVVPKIAPHSGFRNPPPETLDATGTQAPLQCFIKDKDRSHVLGSSVGDKPDTDQKTDGTF